ncbi:biotin-dependent carboxyltransferase family protein [Peribacillus sp. B-H-3]|uniref:5-oxoprolinase subunit C family protein n=1 Tax=Peribacillus sp. B-H-3 TaxID=3400420 RepID=UPI003B01671D
MSIKVIRPGLLTTFQDLGRYGYQKYGVIVSGAMDIISYKLANMLVGNQEDDAALEATLIGPELKIERDMLLAITGANLSPKINGEAVPLWKPLFVKKNSILTFGACKQGCRCYISFSGGLIAEEVLGSRSTYLRAEFGGYRGRALKKDDILFTNGTSRNAASIFQDLRKKEKAGYAEASWHIRGGFFQKRNQQILRVIKGQHFSMFDEKAKKDLFEKTFKIDSHSDRMGYRLSGPQLQTSVSKELLSEAVTHGTIQVPRDGRPIILLSDRQTTGGYPRIAHVASADVPLLGQLKPGESISFQEITLMEAERLLIERENWLDEVKIGIQLKLESY